MTPHRPSVTLGVVALAAALLAACGSSGVSSGGSAGRAAAPTTGQAGTATTPTARATPATTAPSTGQPVTLAFAGDVHFEQQLVDGRIGPMRAQLAAADLAMVNMETAVTARGTAAGKQFVFRGPASALPGLVDAGIDVVTIANNHGMDYGQTGLLDTLAAAKAAGLPLVGGGVDQAAAYAPYRTTVKGERIAVFGATQVLDTQLAAAWTAGPGKPGLASAYEVGTLLSAVRAARAGSDTVVVFLHWGVERNPCPPPQATTVARQLVDAGAAVVVGSHAHVLLGDGRLGNAYIDYGLGNFQFYNGSGATAQTGVLTLTVQGRRTLSASFDPGVMVNGRPQPLTGAARTAALAQRDQRRACTGLAAP